VPDPPTAPDLAEGTAAWLAIGAVRLAGLCLLVALLALLRVRRPAAVVERGADRRRRGDVVAVLGRQRAEIDRLRREVEAARRAADELNSHVGDALRHVAVVRYDAFGDMGGRLSFSAALLDDAGDGVVFSTITGRSDSRTYAKGVKAATATSRSHPRSARPCRTRGAPARVRRTRVRAMPGVPPARYAFLGPEGTFAEAALRTVPAASSADLQPHPTVAAALEAVRCRRRRRPPSCRSRTRSRARCRRHWTTSRSASR
jgi:hypothetical protein